MDIDTYIFDFKKEKITWHRRQFLNWTWQSGRLWGWIRWGYKSGIEHHEISLSKYQLINLLAAMSWALKAYRPNKDKFGPRYMQLEAL